MIDENSLAGILREGVTLRKVEPYIFSVLPAGEDDGISYDRKFGFFYDLMVRSPVYNRVVWGYPVGEYHPFCSAALRSSHEGWVLDAGCGSLVFTARTYAAYADRPVVLLDRSIRLLELAKSRLEKSCGRLPANVALIHGDALRLPFRAQSFQTIISLNLLHVLADLPGAVAEMRRVLVGDGNVALTTLVEGQRLGDMYLHLWARAGELIPRTTAEIVAAFAAVDLPVECERRGNLAFMRHGIEGIQRR